jgi:hypothetical protein
MERYKVRFSSAERGPLTILVPFQSLSPVAVFKKEIALRLAGCGIDINPVSLQLCLDTDDGPVLYNNDPVSTVVFHPDSEVVVAIVMPAHNETDVEHGGHNVEPSSSRGPVGNNSPSSAVHDSTHATDLARTLQNAGTTEHDSGGHSKSVRVRVITAALARRNTILDQIPLMPGVVSEKTTFRQLRVSISHHLALPGNVEDVIPPNENECNCSLARALREESLFKIMDDHHANQVLVIHSKNIIQPLSCSSFEQSDVLQLVQETYRDSTFLNLENKCLKFFAAPVAEGPSSR